MSPTLPQLPRTLPDSKLTEAIESACHAIANGGVAVFPTDTFYALGANALDAAAVAKIFELKGRNEHQPLPVLIPDAESIHDLCDEVPPVAFELAERFWPGALTIVLPKSKSVPKSVTGGGETVGVRVPDHVVALQILCRVGCPVTGTSANPSGTPPTKDPGKIRSWFEGSEITFVDAPCGSLTVPSTVLNLTTSPASVVRAGGVGIDDLRELLPDVTIGPPR